MMSPFADIDDPHSSVSTYNAMTHSMTMSHLGNPYVKLWQKVRHLKFKWYLKFFPNGSSPETAGKFEMKLFLISLPGPLSKLRFHYQLHCHQLNAYWGSTVQFVPTKHFQTNNHDITDTLNHPQQISLNTLKSRIE